MAATSGLKQRIDNLLTIQRLEESDRDFVSATIEPLACDARIAKLSRVRSIAYWLSYIFTFILLVFCLLLVFANESQSNAADYLVPALAVLGNILIVGQADIEIKVLKALKAKGLIRVDEDQGR